MLHILDVYKLFEVGEVKWSAGSGMKWSEVEIEGLVNV
jgi:hypothetical protein